MYKLCIVDDEKQIREGLKNLIPWENYGIQICGEADNGKDALELIAKTNPEILITDIRMPGIDGIELIKAVRQINDHCKIVVLSGYDDFELVRQAMRYGAVDYLLKPSSREEIIQLIEEISDNIEDELNSRLKNNENMKLLKNNVFNRLIRNDISLRELKDKLEVLEVNLSQGYMSVGVIEVTDETNTETADKENFIGKTLAISSICEKIIEIRKRGFVFADNSGSVILILNNIFSQENNMELKEILVECQGAIREELNLHVTIAVGAGVKTHRNIHTSYEQAKKTLKYQFVYGYNCILFYGEIKDFLNKQTNLIDIDSTIIRNLIVQTNYQEFENYMNQIFSKFINKDAIADGYVLKTCALEMLIIAFQCYEAMPMVDRNYVMKKKETSLQKIASNQSLLQMKNTVLEAVNGIISELQERNQKKYSRQVFEIMHCTQMKYDDMALSLQIFAEKYHVNVAYLGRMFTKETGSSFRDYLNLVRIEKAKDLLLTTNYKGSELCEKVGFSNYNYFYIVFKKITGMRPMDFRK